MCFNALPSSLSRSPRFTRIVLCCRPPSLTADLGWVAAAAATPAIMLAAGAGFFGMSLAANQGISVLGMDPAAMAVAGVAAGAITQVRVRWGRGCVGGRRGAASLPA